MLISGSKVTVAGLLVLTASATLVATITKTLGMKGIIVRARNGSAANAITVTANPTFDGTNDALNGLTVTGAAALANGTGGARFIVGEASPYALLGIMVDTVRIYAQAATADTTVSFDIFPIYDVVLPISASPQQVLST